MNNTLPNTVQIYSAGGAGSNVISELVKSIHGPTFGFATMSPCYIDTSRSNLGGKNIDPELMYLFEGIDGSGKVRSMNYELISKNVKSILQKFKPRQFNIVIHSASGGSGSIIGPTLVSELKSRGEMVIVIVIGSTDTRIEINNTINTLKSYESISNLRKSPVVMHYVENTREVSRAEVNHKVKLSISLLMGLFSGQNSELDTADLKNWLEYTKISGTNPILASLAFATSQKELNAIGNSISVASLSMHEMNTRLEQTPAYQCVGYAPDCWRTGAENSLQLINDHPVHYCIGDGAVHDIHSYLSKALKEVDDVFASQNTRNSIVTLVDNVTDVGIVL